MEALFYNSDDVAQMLGVSKSKAYTIIRKLNEELEAKGFITMHGKVSRQYFAEKVYGCTKATATES
ncbi:MAG: hypothetical protein II992_08230 [Lachnospiraceae bacterium]|nr:hypothetical protein [Lachnospiraceae bacterium]